jgi:hypothetical protein
LVHPSKPLNESIDYINNGRRTQIQAALGGVVRWSRVAFFDRIVEVAGLSLDRSTITILNLLAVNGRLRYSELSELLAVR